MSKLVLVLLLGLSVTVAIAAPLKIIGFETGSGITFEGATASNFYTIEFASTVSGQWTNWGSITEQPVTGAVMCAPSPLFYRIKQTDSSAFPPYAPSDHTHTSVSYAVTADTVDGLHATQITASVALLPGAVIPYAGASAPPGWLLCDGSPISRVVYSNLFDVIGTTYGTGDSSTTFNVPNLRGRVPVGYDSTQVEFDVLGEIGGEKAHILQIGEMPLHSHSLAANLGNNGSGSGELEGTYGNAHRINDSGVTGDTGGGTAHNNLSPYVVLKYIIKI